MLNPLPDNMEFRSPLLIRIAMVLGLPFAVFLLAGLAWAQGKMPLTRVWIAVGIVAEVGLLWRLFRGGTALVLDEHGIHENRIGFGLIPWTDVVAIRPSDRTDGFFGGGFSRLVIHVGNEKTYIQRLAWHRRLLAQTTNLFDISSIMVDFKDLRPDLNTALLWLEQHRPATLIRSGNYVPVAEGGRTPKPITPQRERRDLLILVAIGLLVVGGAVVVVMVI